MRRFAAIALVTVLAALVASGAATNVSAHATIVRAEPGENSFLQAAPNRVLLVFSEPLDAAQSEITLLDARGQLVASGAELSSDRLSLRLPLGPLAPGIYNVLWENVSTVDGHALKGSYPFTVLLPGGGLPGEENLVATTGSSVDPPPPAENVAIRALSLFGLVLLVASALPWLLARPYWHSRTATAVGLVAVLTLGVAVVLNLVALHDTNGGRSLSSLLTETRLGQAWIARVGATLLAAGALAPFVRNRAGPLLSLGSAALFVGTYTATSHAAAGTGSAWAMVSDYMHGVSAVTWIGAVAGLVVLARASGRNPGNRILITRFSLLASLSVFVLLATGLLNALVLLDSFDRLWTTRYGVTLLVKFGLMAPLLGLALWNARRGGRQIHEPRPGVPTAFVRTAYLEALAGVAVIVAAAVLTQSTVARNVFERPDERP
ncbi:MAG: copper resistance CopC/CopD family protein, partial [Dehalococcoidia bacterium]